MTGLDAVLDMGARAILDRLPLGVCLLADDFTVTYWNTTLEAWTGIPREQIQRRLLTDQYPHLRSPRFLGRLQSVFEHGTPAVFSPTFHRCFLPASSDRSGDSVSMIQQACVLPVSLPLNGQSVAIVLVEDATRTTQQLAELRTEKQRLIETQEQTHKHLLELEASRRALATMIEEAKQARLQVEQSAEEVRVRNVELDRAREVAETANRSKSEFLANVSHELRTPLTAILGFAEAMAEGCPRQCSFSREHGEHVATIQRNGEYLLAVINDILDLSKVEAGKVEVERTAVSPCRLIADVVALTHARAASKGLQFDIAYEGAIPETIQTSPTRLRQILLNLVGNAIKFTEVGNIRLIVRLAERSGFVAQSPSNPHSPAEFPIPGYRVPAASDHSPTLQLDVVDTGIGMTPTQAAGLFRPFTQADTSMTRKFGGTGLGLVISKRLAQILGGDVAILETAPGRGTRLRITVSTGSLDGVKMLDDPMAATVTTENTVAQSANAGGRLDCRVLLVEDGPDNRRLINAVLKKAGADVTVAENGKIGYEAALAARDAGQPFDVILMDMQMPVMDGYTATRCLRDAGYAGPIIALTAHAMATDRQKCLDAGCDDYATKPIDRPQLIEAIRQRAQAEPLPANVVLGDV